MSEETLTRVPTSVNDHRALLADVLAAKTYDDDFDVKYLTKETRNGPELRTQGRTFTEHTGFKIKHRDEWNDWYPQLREFLQNAFDHLCLVDAHGFRLPWVTLRVTGRGADSYTIAFRIGTQEVLTLQVKESDTLIIKQLHTYPLPPDVLQFRASDDLKSRRTGAGGFGVGFKESIAAILNENVRRAKTPKAGDGTVKYEMYTESRRISWTFKAGRMKKATRGYGGVSCAGLDAKVVASAGYEQGVPPAKVNTLTITIQMGRVGYGLLHSVVSKCTAFFNASDPAKTIATPGGKEPCIALVAEGGLALHPSIVALDATIVPAAPTTGIYARGLWVKPEARLGEGMLFCGRGAADVTSEKRDDVQGDTLRQNLVDLFTRAHHDGQRLPAKIVGVLAGKELDDDTRCFLPHAESGDFGFVAKALVDRGRGEALALLDLDADAAFFEAAKTPREAYMLDALKEHTPRLLYVLGDQPRDAAFCDAKPASAAEELWKRKVSPTLSPSNSPFEAVLYQCLRFAGRAIYPLDVVALALDNDPRGQRVHLIDGDDRIYALRSAPNGLSTVYYHEIVELLTTIIACFADDHAAHRRCARLLQRLPKEQVALEDLSSDTPDIVPESFAALIETMMEEVAQDDHSDSESYRSSSDNGMDTDSDDEVEPDPDPIPGQDSDSDSDSGSGSAEEDLPDPVLPRPPTPLVDTADSTMSPEELRRLLEAAQRKARERHETYEGDGNVPKTALKATPVDGVRYGDGISPSVGQSEDVKAVIRKIDEAFERFPVPDGLEHVQLCKAYEPATSSTGYAGCYCPSGGLVSRKPVPRLFVNAAMCGKTLPGILCTVAHEYAHGVMIRGGFGAGHTHAFRLMEVKLQNKAFDAIYGRKRPREE